MREILERLKEWVIHKLSPHCDDCDHELECRNCEYLRLALEQERAERSRLIGLMYSEGNTNESTSDPYTNVKRVVPWHVKRQQLEAQSRRRKNESRINADDASADESGSDESNASSNG